MQRVATELPLNTPPPNHEAHNLQEALSSAGTLGEATSPRRCSQAEEKQERDVLHGLHQSSPLFYFFPL